MSAINRQDLAMVISRLRSREDFEAWELFYAGSIPSGRKYGRYQHGRYQHGRYQPRNLNSFTKDEALDVLDALMQGEPVEGVWGRTVGVKNTKW